MDKIDLSNITLNEFSLPALPEKNVEVFVLRLDKIHPVISGNKWFKLKFYLEDAKAQDKTTIVTMGGAWSNHIVATAAACQLYALNSIGIIRGEEPRTLSLTLIQAKACGMELIFLSRTNYSSKKIPADLINEKNYFIDEGGYGQKGMEGAATILSYCSKKDFTDICCAVGTGTMLAGLIEAATAEQKVIGISVLKNNRALESSVRYLLNNNKNNFEINHDYHFGGYAKFQAKLLKFMNEFHQQSGIPTDFVYTGKLFYAVNELIKQDFFTPGSKVLIIHSGGLQGNASLNKGTLIF